MQRLNIYELNKNHGDNRTDIIYTLKRGIIDNNYTKCLLIA